jgi:hypothetical protein
MAIPPDRQHKAFKDEYMQKITWEVPQSGALEYIEGFLIFSQTHNINKARRLMQKAKKRATAAKDTGMLQQIELAEQMLSISPGDIMNMTARRVLRRLNAPISSWYGNIHPRNILSNLKRFEMPMNG